MKIYSLKNGTSNEEDRLALATLLLKMGYTVRRGKEKDGNRTIHFVEYRELPPGEEFN